ncbi:MAG TPA: uroporphyrinogen decarboxylase, partial [Candidatus Saccharimonadales bacterium]|nr:uroporphyrinogen decarboxylase [Candidatus Saccharimonadales bacterium]
DPFKPMPTTNHSFLAACRREPTSFTPIWLMRQAGRYMEDYRKLRAQYGFLELCKRPDLATEITVTPVERLGVDAAILFADILLVLEPMGVGLEYSKGDGPVLHRPVRSASDVDGLRDFDVANELSFVYESVKKIRKELKDKVPLIGFAGAPFTLASYLIEGGGSRNYLHTKKLYYSAPEAWQRLMERLAKVVAEYLNCQIAAGAQAVQIFDSWAGCLTPDDYQQFVLPYTKKVIDAIAPGVPVINFSTGTAGALKHIRATGGDVIGLDWRINLDEGWATVGYDVAVQGNLDPVALFASPKEIKTRAADILRRAAGRPGHIFNLGHGVLPETPVDNVIALVDAVHELSAK